MKTRTPLLTGSFVLSTVLLAGLTLHAAAGATHRQNDPEPPVVDAGPIGGPPSDAIVLFDGKSMDNWRGEKSEKPMWDLGDGYMATTPHGGVLSKQEFGDMQLHVEWAEPSEVKGDGQGRGNSGVYLMGRYEVQVLDNYNNKTYHNGQCGALYGRFAPLVNACRKPGEWQAYDMIFHAPKKVPDGSIVAGSLTVLQNGVVIQDHVPITGDITTAGAPIKEFSEKGPIYLQDHGNPVKYRNIWVRPL